MQVLSPLSDSILAEKTVTVLDDKVKRKKKKCGWRVLSFDIMVEAVMVIALKKPKASSHLGILLI